MDTPRQQSQEFTFFTHTQGKKSWLKIEFLFHREHSSLLLQRTIS